MIYKGKEYTSKKHPVLEWIFRQKNPHCDTAQAVIGFTLKDISDGYRACGIAEPASISNTILDLTRKKGSIALRLPESILSLGYDLRKKTGRSPDGINYAGEFVLVGVGKQIQSWLDWGENLEEIEVSSAPLPDKIRPFLRADEGALFSVIDYCDVFSWALHKRPNVVWRVQNPMKWQPNEIDGFYFAEIDGQEILLPVEAKALVTGDDINLVQMQGALETVAKRYRQHDVLIMPLAIQMVRNGIKIAVFQQCSPAAEGCILALERVLAVSFSPPLEAWS